MEGAGNECNGQAGDTGSATTRCGRNGQTRYAGQARSYGACRATSQKALISGNTRVF